MSEYPISEKDFTKALTDAKTNRTAILLFEDTDGNWRGMLYKKGVIKQARQVDPSIVITLLLTHE